MFEDAKFGILIVIFMLVIGFAVKMTLNRTKQVTI